MTPTLPVEATEDLGAFTDTPIIDLESNTGGTEIEKEELEEQEYTIEGASPRRTGYLIWASDGSGLSNIYSPTSI